MPETYREQWREAAVVLREHANKLDEMAETAPPRPVDATTVQVPRDDLEWLLGRVLVDGTYAKEKVARLRVLAQLGRQP